MLTADLVVTDRQDEPLLVAEVKATLAGTEALSELLEYVRSLRRSNGEPVPFAMLVDPETIRVYRTAREDSLEPVDSLPSREVFAHYDPEFRGEATPHGTRKVFEWYLAGLARGWLADLIESWKPGTPPRAQSLADVGLLGRLEGASVAEEVHVCGDPVR